MANPLQGRNAASVGAALNAVTKGASLKEASARFRVPQRVLRMLLAPGYHEPGQGRPTATDRQIREQNAYWRRIALGAAKGETRAQARGHARFADKYPEGGPPPTLSTKDDAIAQELLRMMRGTSYQKPMTLGQAAKELGVSGERARRLVRVGGAEPQRGKRYIIPGGTQEPFYSDGRSIVAVFDKHNASIVGAYMYATRKALDKKNGAPLAAFDGQTVTDVEGNEYTLETRFDIVQFLAVQSKSEGKSFEKSYRIVPIKTKVG